MDFYESTKVVYKRIQKLEPENVAKKIIEYLLLQNHGEREMIRLAFSPDNLIQSVVDKAKRDLGLSSKLAIPASVSPPQVNTAPVSDLPIQFTQFSPSLYDRFPPPLTLQVTNANWDPQVAVDQQSFQNLEFIPGAYWDSVIDDSRLQKQLQFLSLEDQLEKFNSTGTDLSTKYYYPEPISGPRASRRSPSLPEFPLKVCHYFNRGFCKHGSNCRYFHGHLMPESFSQIFNPSSTAIANEDHVVSPVSLKKLELELTELLKSRRGAPVSIASLPNLYYEKYGKTLQAEGYLTESKRHGKAGYSLTKLLARMKNSIHLVKRPHGQHAVIFADDIPNDMQFNAGKSELEGTLAGSHQIYLTFSAESSFSELNVFSYFNKFGPVHDVRIPCQQKRMFGFVTFVYPKTVEQILAKGNPHFVCGSRVLVKPYREKSKLSDRKHMDKVEQPMYCGSQFLDADCAFHPISRVCDNSRLPWKQFMNGQEEGLELEQRSFLELQLAYKSWNRLSGFGYSMDDLKPLEDVWNDGSQPQKANLGT